MQLSPDLKNVQSWCEGRSPQLAAQAVQFVAGVSNIHRTLETLKKRRFVEPPPKIDRKQWLSFYRNSKMLWWVLIDEHQKNIPDDAPQPLRDVKSTFLKLKNEFRLMKKSLSHGKVPDSDLYESFCRSMAEFKQAGELIHIPIMEMMQKSNFAPPQPSGSNEISSMAPELFFVHNIWPITMTLYGSIPTPLYRKARLGNEYALEALLRLDRNILYDPFIQKHIRHVEVTNQDKAEEYYSWLNSKPKINDSRQFAKYLSGGFLLKQANDLTAQWGQPQLTAPEIHALFDAYAKDHGLGDNDPDFQDITNDAFYRGIKKACDHWTNAFRPELFIS